MLLKVKSILYTSHLKIFWSRQSLYTSHLKIFWSCQSLKRCSVKSDLTHSFISLTVAHIISLIQTLVKLLGEMPALYLGTQPATGALTFIRWIMPKAFTKLGEDPFSRK